MTDKAALGTCYSPGWGNGLPHVRMPGCIDWKPLPAPSAPSQGGAAPLECSYCCDYRHLAEASSNHYREWLAKIAAADHCTGCSGMARNALLAAPAQPASAPLPLVRSTRERALEEAAQVVDECNREGPYQAIGAADRIRALASAPETPAQENDDG